MQECASGNAGDAAVEQEKEEEKSFVDVGFHAFATAMVEDDDDVDGHDNSTPDSEHHQTRSASDIPVDICSSGCSSSSAKHASCSTAPRDRGARTRSSQLQRKIMSAGGQEDEEGGRHNTNGSAVKKCSPGSLNNSQHDSEELEDDDDEDDFGEVELVITEDGGVIPVASAVAGENFEPKEAAAALLPDSGTRRAYDVDVAAAAIASDCLGGAPRHRLIGGDGGCEEGKREPTLGRGVKRSARASAMAEAKAASGYGGRNGDGDAPWGDVVSERAAQATLLEVDHGGAIPQEQEDQEGNKIEDAEVEVAEREEVGVEEENKLLPPDIVLTLDDDVLHRTMLYVHPEDVLECRAVSSRWDFPAHEAVYEGLCRRTYLAQVRAPFILLL